MHTTSTYREISSERLNDFLKLGYKQRDFFPHKAYYLPKCGPDGYMIAQKMCGETDTDKLWEIVLYAINPTINEFPEEPFFDDELIWHQQRFGKAGQIATANLRLDGDSLYAMVHIPDLAQRISRRREFRTRIENRFNGWPYMLLNGILCFSLENNINNIHTPTAEFALENTDDDRQLEKPLFETVYDGVINNIFTAKKNQKWWGINVEENKDNVVLPTIKKEKMKYQKTICINHDIERGLGHIGIDRQMVEEANKLAPRFLNEMLKIEKELNIKATYNVVGCILNEVRDIVERDGHCIAFHSYDHNLDDQLWRCKDVDRRARGYRIPMSKFTPEITEEELCFNNFEWLASSADSFGFKQPAMESRIVKIPILFDDFDLYKENLSFRLWEKKAISAIEENEFVAFGMHDCYGRFWLPYYEEFLKKIRRLGDFKTMDEVSSDVIFSCAQ